MPLVTPSSCPQTRKSWKTFVHLFRGQRSSHGFVSGLLRPVERLLFPVLKGLHVEARFRQRIRKIWFCPSDPASSSLSGLFRYRLFDAFRPVRLVFRKARLKSCAARQAAYADHQTGQHYVAHFHRCHLPFLCVLPLLICRPAPQTAEDRPPITDERSSKIHFVFRKGWMDNPLWLANLRTHDMLRGSPRKISSIPSTSYNGLS